MGRLSVVIFKLILTKKRCVPYPYPLLYIIVSNKEYWIILTYKEGKNRSFKTFLGVKVKLAEQAKTWADQQNVLISDGMRHQFVINSSNIYIYLLGFS